MNRSALAAGTWLGLCGCTAGLSTATAESSTLADPCIVYVNADVATPGDGAGWGTAAADLQSAIDRAAALALSRPDRRCSVWATTGTTSGDGSDRTEVLRLRPGVWVYGGFAGTEATLDERERDPETGLMRLPSVLDGRGVATHVVVGADDARLDGFEVRGGSADDPSDANLDGFGGGMFNDGVRHLVVANTLFRGNVARNGGAMFNRHGEVTLDNVHFLSNRAHWNGGAIEDRGMTRVLVRDATFADNTAERGHGGAISNVGVSAFEVEDTRFVRNDAAFDGGAVAHLGGDRARLVEVWFRDNNAARREGLAGGALHLAGFTDDDVTAGRSDSPRPLGVVEIVGGGFVGNVATEEGGAIFATRVTSLSIDGALLSGNLAASEEGGRGGALAARQVDRVRISEAAIVGNTALFDGGGVLFDDGVDLVLQNVRISSNVAETGSGGGVFATNTAGSMVLRQTWFRENQSHGRGGGLYGAGFSSLDVEGGGFEDNRVGEGGFGGGVFTLGWDWISSATFDDVSFVHNTASGVGGAMADIHLRALEVRGAEFVENDTAMDLPNTGAGVYAEFLGDVVVEQSLFARNGLAGSTWEGAGLHLKDFHHLAIRDSTWVGNIADLGAAVSTCVSVPGGAARSVPCTGMWSEFHETDGPTPHLGVLEISDTTWERNRTIREGGALLAGGLRRVVVDGGAVAENGGGFVLEGVGAAHLARLSFRHNQPPTGGGALIFRYGGTLDVSASEFLDNSAGSSGAGGGLFVEEGDTAEVRSSRFANNQAAADGGAVWVGRAPALVVTDSTFEGNRCTGSCGGGAISVRDVDTLRVERCAFESNVAGVSTDERGGYGGGAVIAHNVRSTRVSDSLFARNAATNPIIGGGGALLHLFEPEVSGPVAEIHLTNTTLYANRARFGPAVRVFRQDVARPPEVHLGLYNSIVWGHDAPDAVVGATEIAFSDVPGLTTGDANLDLDPQFVSTDPSSPAAFRLSPTSPCRDAGSEAYASEFDLVGNARVSTPDMGAFEVQ